MHQSKPTKNGVKQKNCLNFANLNAFFSNILSFEVYLCIMDLKAAKFTFLEEMNDVYIFVHFVSTINSLISIIKLLEFMLFFKNRRSTSFDRAMLLRKFNVLQPLFHQHMSQASYAN
jgi:hypothetical protein